MRISYSKWIVEVICILFVILFLYTAVSKILDYENFKVVIGQSPMLGRISGYVAIGIPLIEIVAVILLVISKSRRIGLILSFGLMVMFTIYIIAILNFAEKVPCSCGGVIQELGWKAHIYFNLAFVFLALIAILINTHETKLRIN